MFIGNREVGPGNPVFIIAEAGVNHNGNLDYARQLIHAAKVAGADAVKFQSFSTGALVRRGAPKAAYQDRNIGVEKSQYQMLTELELNSEQTLILRNYARQEGIIFFSTPYDLESVDMLLKIDIPVFKLASMDVVFHPLIAKIARTGKPLILSTGMATENEIRDAAAAWHSSGGRAWALLQCNTNYPSRSEDQNLRAMNMLSRYADVVGYSDHTEGSVASVVAVGAGARILERHLTLDCSMPGPDHKASLDPGRFALFVQRIREAEVLLGSPGKYPSGGEFKNIIAMRRSICARHFIPKGAIIGPSHLAFKRPGDGLAPTLSNIEFLLRRIAKRHIQEDENIMPDMVMIPDQAE